MVVVPRAAHATVATYSSDLIGAYEPVTTPTGGEEMIISAYLAQVILTQVQNPDGSFSDQQDVQPMYNETVHLAYEDANGIWRSACDAKTNYQGIATCVVAPWSYYYFGQLTYVTVSAWSAVFQGDDNYLDTSIVQGSSDYGRVAGSPDPPPTPPGDGQIQIIPDYTAQCQPVSQNQASSLFGLLTEGGNCHLAQLEQQIFPAVVGAASFVLLPIGLAGISSGLTVLGSEMLDSALQAGNDVLANALARIGTAQIVKGAYFVGGVLDGNLVGAAVSAGLLASREPWLVPPDNTFQIGAGTTFQNNGVITNDGEIADATQSDGGAGTLVNDGTVINNGTISNSLVISGNNYTLDFDDNGGSGALSPLQVLAATVTASGQALPVPEPPAGERFIGWSTASTGGTLVSGGTDLSALLPTGPSISTLYAQYEAAVAATTTHAVPGSVTYSTAAQNARLSGQVVPWAGPTYPFSIKEGTASFSLLDSAGHAVGQPLTTTVGSDDEASVSYLLPAGLAAGEYTIQASYTDPAGNFSPSADATQDLTVAPASTSTTTAPTITYNGTDSAVGLSAQVTSPGGTVNEGSVSFTLLDQSGQEVGTTSAGNMIDGAASATYPVPANTPSGNYSVEVVYSDPFHNFATSSGGAGIQTITEGWGYGYGLVGNSLSIPVPTSSSGNSNDIQTSVDPSSSSVCSYSTNTALLSFIGVGNCVVDFYAPPSTGYAPARLSRSIPVEGYDAPTTSSLPTSATVGTTLPFSVSSPSGSPVEVKVDPVSAGICELVGGNLDLESVGSCYLDVATTGDPEYLPVSEHYLISVTGAPQSLTLGGLLATQVGQSFPVEPGSSSGVAVTATIDSTSSNVCELNGNVVTFELVGPCQFDLAAPASGNYAAAAATQTVTVTPGLQQITFSTPPASPTVGETYSVVAHSTSGSTVVLTIDLSTSANCSLDGTNVRFEQAGPCEIDGSVGASNDYLPATDQQTVEVGSGPQVITNAGPPPGTSATDTSPLGSTTASAWQPTFLSESTPSGTVSFSAPGGALPNGPVSLYSIDTSAFTPPANSTFVGGFAVSWTGGQPAAQPVTMTVTNDPAIRAGDLVYMVNPDGTLSQVGTATQDGTATVTFTADPAFLVAHLASTSPAPTSPSPTPVVVPQGYRLVSADGGAFDFGSADFFGSKAGKALPAAVVGTISTPDHAGYWMVGADGSVYPFGDARAFGTLTGKRLAAPIVGMVATPDGGGYWLVGADGGVFSFGDAVFYGSTGALRLNRSIVGMVATPDGGGYWLVGADGGVFSFGDAVFYGSTGALHLAAPITAAAGT